MSDKEMNAWRSLALAQSWSHEKENPVKQAALIKDKVQFEDTWHLKTIVLCLALENVGIWGV